MRLHFWLLALSSVLIFSFTALAKTESPKGAPPTQEGTKAASLAQEESALAPCGVCNLKHQKDDLVLPGPENTCFVFRPVYVEAETVLGGSTFIMGDAESDDFRTPPTRVVVGGAFEGDPDKGSWMFYMGKYEVTRAQYRAVMGTLPGKLAKEKATPETDRLPITDMSYFESLEFTDRLNRWLYANATDKLPSSGPFPGFVRLPSEVEWEFAARGGLTVEKSRFESATPYTDQLTAHEWFSGPKSSHGKLKPVGQLAPNPLGIHDMLGNVQEIVNSQYQLEYYQGRSGGFVSRGGHYLLTETAMRSALRQEEPYYRPQGKTVVSNAKATMGFRLLMSAPLLTNREAIAAFSEAWDQYRQGAGSQTPAALSVAPPSVQENVSVNDAMQRLNRLSDTGETSVSIEDIQRELAYAKAELLKTMDIRRKADADTARVYMEGTELHGQTLLKLVKQRQYWAQRSQENSEDGKPDYGVQKLSEASTNVVDMLERYRTYIEAMSKLPTDVVNNAFESRKSYQKAKLEKATAEKSMSDAQASGEALNILEIMFTHYTSFAKDMKGNLGVWDQEYTSLISQPKNKNTSDTQ